MKLDQVERTNTHTGTGSDLEVKYVGAVSILNTRIIRNTNMA